MPTVIDLRLTDDLRDVVHRAVQALVEGRLVVFPTETVYGIAANALDAAAVARLCEAKGRSAGHPLALAIKGLEEALDFVPDLCPLARRLARRCWPGPVTLVVEDAHPESLLNRLPAEVRRAVMPGKTIGLRVPGHEFFLETLRYLAGPLVLSSANLSGQPETTSGRDAAAAVGDWVDLVLDDGPCRYGQASSVVKVVGNQLEVLRAGAVPERILRSLACFHLVLVCTGNTCRSPMAELLSKRFLAERLGCLPTELEDRGVMVSSAGLAAMLGGRASAEAVAVMNEYGLDLTGHETQPITDSLVRQADLLLTMTRAHRDAIVGHWPEAAERTLLVSPDGADICDPIGGPIDRYRRCAAQLEQALSRRISSLEL